MLESSRVIEYAISHCTGKNFLDSGGLLLKVLLKIYDIDEMSFFLDREQVEEFCISVDYNTSSDSQSVISHFRIMIA
jgi:hypothetical protein